MNAWQTFVSSGTPFWMCLIYLAFFNILTFVLMGVDKARAKAGSRRIREADLFLCACLGGALGGILGMVVFRHKTKHLSFLVGFPCLLIFHLMAAALLLAWADR